MAKLNDARRSLERAKESALERLRQLEDERHEIKSSLKSLNAALKALANTKSSRGKNNYESVPEQAEDFTAKPRGQKSNHVSSRIYTKEGSDNDRTSEQ